MEVVGEEKKKEETKTYRISQVIKKSEYTLKELNSIIMDPT